MINEQSKKITGLALYLYMAGFVIPFVHVVYLSYSLGCGRRLHNITSEACAPYFREITIVGIWYVVLLAAMTLHYSLMNNHLTSKGARALKNLLVLACKSIKQKHK